MTALERLQAYLDRRNYRTLDGQGPPAGLREDLSVALEMLRDGAYPGVVVVLPHSLDNPIRFIYGNTWVWAGEKRWQVADMIDSSFQNHRGFSPCLHTTLQLIIEEK